MFLHDDPLIAIQETMEGGSPPLPVLGTQSQHLKGLINDQPLFMGLIKVEKKAMKVSL